MAGSGVGSLFLERLRLKQEQQVGVVMGGLDDHAKYLRAVGQWQGLKIAESMMVEIRGEVEEHD